MDIDFCNATESPSAELLNCACDWGCYSQNWKGLKSLTATKCGKKALYSSKQKQKKPQTDRTWVFRTCKDCKSDFITLYNLLLLRLRLLWGRWAIHHVLLYLHLLLHTEDIKRSRTSEKRAGPRPKSKPTRNARVCGRFSVWEHSFAPPLGLWQNCSNGGVSDENYRTVRGSSGSWCDGIRQQYFGRRFQKVWPLHCTCLMMSDYAIALETDRRPGQKIAKEPELFPEWQDDVMPCSMHN